MTIKNNKLLKKSETESESESEVESQVESQVESEGNPSALFPFRAFLKNLFFGKNSNPKIQMVRSIFTSNISFIIDASLFVLIVKILLKPDEMGVYPFSIDSGVAFLSSFIHFEVTSFTAIVVFCSLLSYLMGTLVLYLLSIYWVFSNRSIANPHHERVIFFILAAVGLLLNSSAITFLVTQLHFPLLLSKVVSGIVIFFFNFTARKLLLFRN